MTHGMTHSPPFPLRHLYLKEEGESYLQLYLPLVIHYLSRGIFPLQRLYTDLTDLKYTGEGHTAWNGRCNE